MSSPRSATGLADTFPQFVLWRIVGGVAIGIASNLSPMYIAEIAPAAIRGKLVSLNQLNIVIGIVLAQVVNWLVARPVAADASALEILELVERPVRLALDVLSGGRARRSCSWSVCSSCRKVRAGWSRTASATRRVAS